jgi:hypothetical protein
MRQSWTNLIGLQYDNSYILRYELESYVVQQIINNGTELYTWLSCGPGKIRNKAMSTQMSPEQVVPKTTWNLHTHLSI